jgi:hypothetical protein
VSWRRFLLPLLAGAVAHGVRVGMVTFFFVVV